MAKLAKHGAHDRRPIMVSKQDKERNRQTVRIVVLLLIIVISFVAGFLVRSQPAFVSSLGFQVQEEVETGVSQKTTYDSVSARVSEVEDILSANSLEEYELPVATQDTITGFMESTGDPYATYYTSDHYDQYIRETADRTYAGVGVLFSEYNGRAYVADVFEGSEAEAKGVMQGDFVVAIDGESNSKWSMTAVINALAEREGENVVISWMSPISLDAETGEEFNTSLKCQRYDVANVTSELVDEVGYIKIRQLTQNASELVKQAVTDLTNNGAKAFVIDLRDNPGGYLTQAVDTASLFLHSGVIVEITTIDGTTTKTASGETITDKPIVLIVNEYTSAAAEVLVAALKDNQRATVVGETTLGKGSVQVMRELSFGGAVRYTAAYYRTPLGRDIDEVGIAPHVAVAGDTDSIAQKNVAIDTALSLI